MTATDVDPQALVDTLRTRSAKLRTDLLERGAKLSELRSLPEDKRGDTHAADLRSAADEIRWLDTELSTVDRLLEPIPTGQRAPERPESRGPGAAFAPLGDDEPRTSGERAVTDDAYTDWAQRRGAAGSFPEIQIRGAFLGMSDGVRTLVDSDTSGAGNGGLWRPVGTPVLPPQNVQQQRLFVRDLLSVQQTGLSSVPYLREVSAGTNGVTAVAEGADKPELSVQFVQDDAPVRKLAGWIPVTSEVMWDAPTLRGYIDTRLRYLLALREEKQVLSGGGNAPNLKGILDFSGVQTQAAVAGDVPATIAAAIGKVENVDGYPNGIAMNPLDFWTQVATRHSTQFDGQGINSGGIPYTAPPMGIWGLPTVRTRSLTALTCVVGDWRLGATLFDRMQTVLRTSDSHSDYFIKNQLAILVEERVALAVHRPDFFVNTTIAHS